MLKDSVWHVSGFGVEPKQKTRRPRATRVDGVAALRVYRGICEVTANKFELEDVEGDLEALAAAEQYTREYTGDFDYMRSMQDALARFKSLSFAQAKGVLNCLRADVQRAARQSVQTAASTQSAPKSGPAVPYAKYTVVLADGSHVTLSIEHSDKLNADIACYMYGSDNQSDFKGFAFVHGDRFNVWKRFQNGFERQIEALRFLLSGTAEDALAAGKMYAMQSGRCCVCNRELTDPESIEAGIGPVCAGKFS